jgi:DNA-binding transcriptional ArsR family regulator
MATSLASSVFRALADPTRRAILDTLRRGELPVGSIAERFPVSRPAISKHLRILRDARLVLERRDGRLRICSLDPDPLIEVDEWVDRYRSLWRSRLVALKRFVEAPPEAPGQVQKKRPARRS